MKFRHRSQTADKTELSMTSMIDIVFLLLVFFVMTFKISAQEGDFNVKMPLEGVSGPSDNTQLPLKLRLISNGAGGLQEIVLNDNLSFGTDWEKLRGYIVGLVGDAAGPGEEEGPEVEIDLDYDLHYVHVISAITSVTGYRSGNDIVKLIDRIKFAKQRK
ncbi:ExbD/TolR family protein [Aureliella helgolandensis]|uniref:Biopolymer transport protein ExbD/TolR n=1 Tax=Aureliella helgolandensis TaxID=2527968 RepID=A0A518GF59_9BACT|nr:biopolymer transporter ExbD [Aureliella helgolandensis]QDV27229.1 Biopolymer transport protein ExbD/TolR [Aureliella helgolandensis]